MSAGRFRQGRSKSKNLEPIFIRARMGPRAKVESITDEIWFGMQTTMFWSAAPAATSSEHLLQRARVVRNGDSRLE